jgi:hypothetical protein
MSKKTIAVGLVMLAALTAVIDVVTMTAVGQDSNLPAPPQSLQAHPKT